MPNKDMEKSVDTIDGKPYYYIDSSIIVILQRLDEYYEQGKGDDEIMAFLTKNGRMNEGGARNLLEKYELNKKGKVVFCITPTVYRETMLDARVKYTHDFVKSRCKLVMPNMNLAQYADLVRTIALEFETAKSDNGHKGLNPMVDAQTGIDDNLEDRTILAEVVAFSLLGKRNIRFLDCGKRKSFIRENDKDVESLERRYKQCQVGYGRDISRTFRKNDVINIFMHSNHNDFGDSSRDSKDVRQVSLRVKDIIEKVLSNRSRLNVLTPDEVEKGGF